MIIPLTLVAHRGYSAKAPENTLTALLLAIAHGYKDVEFDVQLSKDGIPVVIHDETLERTTNGTGLVKDHTFAELHALDAGSWYGELYTGHHIPSLLQVLTALKGIARLHVELKSTEPELASKVAGLLQQTGWLADVQRQSGRQATRSPLLVISSFERDQVARSIQALPPYVIHELLVETVSDESMKWAAAHKVRSYMPDARDITPELIRRAHKLGLHIGAWWDKDVEQDALPLAKFGGHYAFVDSPDIHYRGRWAGTLKRIGR